MLLFVQFYSGGLMVFTVSKIVLSKDEQEIFIGIGDAISDLVQEGVWELVEKTDIPYFSSHEAILYTIRRL